MNSPESLKGKINYISKQNNLRAQEVLHMYFFERVLDRLEKSKFKMHFIIKGGLLIASLIGLESRTTLDMDTTVKGIPLRKKSIRKIINAIITVEMNDGINFEFIKISSIREDDEYENFRVHLIANYGKIKNPLKIDITTGDKITPREIEYNYRCMFEERNIGIMAYNLETILAEKYESIIKRNISSTRMRDFYDVYILSKIKGHKLDFKVLKEAIKKTALKRNSLDYIKGYKELIEEMKHDSYLQELWEAYLSENQYIGNLEFNKTIEAVQIIGDRIKI